MAAMTTRGDGANVLFMCATGMAWTNARQSVGTGARFLHNRADTPNMSALRYALGARLLHYARKCDAMGRMLRLVCIFLAVLG